MTTTLLDATRTCGISGDRWHREQPAGPAHKLLLRVVLRLRFRVRTIKEKSYDLLEDFFADVHSAVDAIGPLNPIYFANSDFPQLSFSTIAELDVGVRDLAIEEAAEYLARIGVPREKLRVTGIPIDPLFAAPLNRFEARKRLGLDADAAVILISAGGHGVGPLEQLVRDLLTLQRPWQIVAIAGKPEKIRRRLEELAKEAGKLPRGSPKLCPVGFTTEMDKYMAAADLMVGKTGGLTTSEALSCSLPMALIEPIPGQEERNADHLLEAGAAIRCNNLPAAAWKIAALLDDSRPLGEDAGRREEPGPARRRHRRRCPPAGRLRTRGKRQGEAVRDANAADGQVQCDDIHC